MLKAKANNKACVKGRYVPLSLDRILLATDNSFLWNHGELRKYESSADREACICINFSAKGDVAIVTGWRIQIRIFIGRSTVMWPNECNYWWMERCEAHVFEDNETTPCYWLGSIEQAVNWNSQGYRLLLSITKNTSWMQTITIKSCCHYIFWFTLSAFYGLKSQSMAISNTSIDKLVCLFFGFAFLNNSIF